MKNCIIALIVLTSFFSCGKNDTLEDFDHLIFGTYYGECDGSDGCVEIFKIENGQLFEDLKDQYPNSNGNEYDWELLDDAKYELVKDIPEVFPDSLLESQEQVFGGPDTYDQGGVFVGIKNGSEVQFWFMDTASAALPSFLVDFKDRILTAVEQLN